jgi:hypothetical protein
MTRGELLDFTAEVAWRFNAYDSYGCNRATAIRAIRRKCDGFTPRQVENAFDSAMSLYDFVQPLVKKHTAEFWAQTEAGDKSWSLSTAS